MTATRGQVRLELERSSAAGRAARSAIDEKLDGLLDAEARASLRTVISELVNNAVQHGGAGPIGVEIAVSRDLIGAEVRDGGTGSPRSPRSPARSRRCRPPAAATRRGRSRWGVSSEGGTRVWCELSRPRRGA
jgi:anti-sigma regulatory factor (Ser/Thr protein kinase)